MIPPPSGRPQRIVFLGTPATAVPMLRAIHAAGHEIPLVVSRPDARRGRGPALLPSPVKSSALDLGLAVSDRADDLLRLDLDPERDLGVVVAYGRIIGPRVLDALALVNVHFSLLPRWRGAAPIERTILAGDRRTGVCLMAVEEGLDTGGVYARTEVAIGDDDSAEELRHTLVEAGSALLVGELQRGLGESAPQRGEATYAEKIQPEDLHLDWSSPAVDLHRTVRVGGAWTVFRGRRLKIWRSEIVADDDAGAKAPLGPGVLSGTHVGTVSGVLALIEVQPEGKDRQPALAWERGARPRQGERLGP